MDNQMLSKSLNIELTNRKIITDIDDCIFFTSNEISKNGLNKKSFWFDEPVYEANKNIIFENAKLTEWGVELLDFISKGLITDYLFITSAKNRMDILVKKLGIKGEFIKESMPDESKIVFLNKITYPCIYVDDKINVINEISNRNIIKVNFPKSFQVIYEKRRFMRRF